MPRALHDGAAGRGVAAHEQGNAEDAFIAVDGDFGRRAILHDVQERNDARGGEIDVLQLGAGFIEDITEAHRYRFQMRCEPLEVAGRQGVEKMVLPRSMRNGHGVAAGGLAPAYLKCNLAMEVRVPPYLLSTLILAGEMIRRVAR